MNRKLPVKLLIIWISMPASFLLASPINYIQTMLEWIGYSIISVKKRNHEIANLKPHKYVVLF